MKHKAKDSPRGKAVSKLLKDLPGEDEGDQEQGQRMPAPEEDGMPGAMPGPTGSEGGDGASGAEAAGGLDALLGGSAGEQPGAASGGDEQPEAMDLDAALSGVEDAIQDMPEAAAREIRTHIEAIKEIASANPGMNATNQPQDGDGSMAQPAGDIPPPGNDIGMEDRRP